MMQHQQLEIFSHAQISSPIRRQLSKYQAEQFYQEHKGKFFYQRLVSFIISGPIEVYILTPSSKESRPSNITTTIDPITEWRKLMGVTHLERYGFMV